MTISRYAKGRMGEDTALRFLCGMGMSLVDHRYRANGGEIDLILLDGDVLVLVEVKARERGGRLAGQTAVTPAKQRRICRAALRFLQENALGDSSVRFDVLEVTPAGITHLRNAFSYIE